MFEVPIGLLSGLIGLLSGVQPIVADASWQSMAADDRRLSYHLNNHKSTGVVVRTIKPGEIGRVRFKGTDWNAIAVNNQCIKEAEYVSIIEEGSLTLLVDKSNLNRTYVKTDVQDYLAGKG